MHRCPLRSASSRGLLFGQQSTVSGSPARSLCRLPENRVNGRIFFPLWHGFDNHAINNDNVSKFLHRELERAAPGLSRGRCAETLGWGSARGDPSSLPRPTPSPSHSRRHFPRFTCALSHGVRSSFLKKISRSHYPLWKCGLREENWAPPEPRGQALARRGAVRGPHHVPLPLQLPLSYSKADVSVFMKSRMFALFPSPHAKQIMATLTSPSITPQQLKTFMYQTLYPVSMEHLQGACPQEASCQAEKMSSGWNNCFLAPRFKKDL